MKFVAGLLLSIALCIGVGCIDVAGPRPAASFPVPTAPPTVTPGFKQHVPYAQGECSTCHDPGRDILTSAQATFACLGCHEKMLTDQPIMHGPVLSAACTRCHTAHESGSMALLLTTGQQMCTQCHEKSSLSRRSTAHLSSKRECIECHLGHGGATRHFLKPDYVLPYKSTLPSTTRNVVSRP